MIIADHGGINALVNMLHAPRPQGVAALALDNLAYARSPDNSKEIGEAGAIPLLVALLCVNDVTTQTYSQ